jgi:hypothetical protein
MKARFSWAQLIAGRLPRSGTQSRTPPRSSSLRRVWKEAAATLPQMAQHGGPFASTTTTTWKENAPATTMFPPRTAEPWSEASHPSEQHHAHYEGQLMQAHARHSAAEPGIASQRSHLASKQIATVVQPDAPPRCEPVLKKGRILIVDITSS